MFTEGTAYPPPLTTLKISHMNYSKMHYVVTNPKTRMIPKWVILSQTAWYRTATGAGIRQTTVRNTNIFHINNILKKVIELKTPILRNKLCWRKQLRCGSRILSGGGGAVYEAERCRPSKAELREWILRSFVFVKCPLRCFIWSNFARQSYIGLCNHTCLYCCCHLFNIIIKYERNNTWLKR